MKSRRIVDRITTTMRRLTLLSVLVLVLNGLAAWAQDAVTVLLPRVNSLRSSQGLPPYTLHSSLTAAANNHARWMAETGEISHYQHDGSGPRTRALNAGFPTNWVSENIYRGASAQTAWAWWLNSPPHYAGIVSPYYDKIGIGSASGAYGNSFVLVFGNSSGRLPDAGARANGGNRGSAAAGPQSFVLGLDEVGNIMHEVQPGQTIGHILLIYGYTWDEYPYLLQINGMSEADRLNLQPGSVILVPPHDGTFTPAPAAPDEPATPEPTRTSEPRATETPTPTLATPTASRPTPLTIRIRALSTESAESISPPTRNANNNGARLVPLALLGTAIIVQLSVIGIATIELIRRSR